MGIDPGLIKTGYGLIEVIDDECKILDFGIITPDKSDKLSNRLSTIYTDISSIINKFKPSKFTDWTTKSDNEIDFDLQKTPLQIRTNSAAGQIALRFYNQEKHN